MARLDPTGVSRILSYIKTWVTNALGGKANSSHSHTKNQITDFPTIPSSTSQLTNDSGYITSSGSCNYANSAGSAGSATTAEAVSTSVAADSSKALVYSSMADNDFCRILVGGSSNAGYVEIATADDGNEPIYVRQYTGVFSSVTRTLTLLDGSGNTSFPGTVTASTFSGNLNGNCSGSCNYANSAGSSSIATRDSGGTWISGRDNAVVKQTRHSTEDGNSWNPAVSVKTKSGNWTIGTVGYDKLQFSYDTDEDYTTGNNRNIVVELLPESGTIITSANVGSQSVNYANSAGSVAWDNVSGKPSAFTPYFANGTWYNVGDDVAIGDHNRGGGLGICGLNDTTRIDFCQYGNAGNYKSITYDGTTLYMNGNCDYANSAGNSDTLDGYHEYSFLRYRGGTSTSGEGTLWAQIGIKGYYNALPDGLSGVYSWGEVVSLAGGNAKFDIYCSHMSSAGNGLYYRSGWDDDKKAWRRLIDDGNTGNISISGYQVYVG